MALTVQTELAGSHTPCLLIGPLPGPVGFSEGRGVVAADSVVVGHVARRCVRARVNPEAQMFTDFGHGVGPRGDRPPASPPRPPSGASRRDGVQRRSARVERRARRNLIIDWLRQKPAPFLNYVRSLRVMDESLGLSLKEGYTLRDPRLRLATTLFMDFAHGHVLSAGEIALLLDDAQRDAREALEYLFERARDEVYERGDEPAGFLAEGAPA